MKDIIFNPSEKKILDAVEEFFGTRTVTNHLTFIDKWMELLLGGQSTKKWTKPGDLYFFYERMEALFEASCQVHETVASFAVLEANAMVEASFLATEKQALTYFPYQLNEKELLNPIKTLRLVFKKQNLAYYQQTLKEWVAEGLNDNYAAENADIIIPLYTNAKKLIAACWLIHERVITQNSFKPLIYPNPLLNFALTEPSLFDAEEVNDPFSMIESFFNFTNLSGYRKAIQNWYMVAITENLAEENPSDLLFMYNQYIQLIQAGYLIAAQKLEYAPKPSKHDGGTLGQWLLSVRDCAVEKGEITLTDEEPQLLSLAERAAPMQYCIEALSHANLVKLRFGLKEWLGAGMNDASSIHGLDHDYQFGLYLTLQKLTEAFYLILTENAKTNTVNITDASHEA